MFVGHFVTTIILNRKQFDFFVSDKPLSRYHMAHPSTSNLWCCIQLRFSYIKIDKLNKKIFFSHFLTLFIKPNNFHIYIFHGMLRKKFTKIAFFLAP